MALIKCPECGKEISDRSKACVHCGFPLDEYTPEPRKSNESNIANPVVEEPKPVQKEVVHETAVMSPKMEHQKELVDDYPSPTQNRSVKFIVIVVAVILIGWFAVNNLIILPQKYNAAEELLIDGKYSNAASAFEELGNYKDSQKNAEYATALGAYYRKSYESALEIFESLDGFRNSEAYLDSIVYRPISSELSSGTQQWDINWDYDEHGNLIYFVESSDRENIGPDKGKIVWQLRKKYTYDSNGNLLSMITQDYAYEEPTVSSSYDYTYTYNSDGTIKESVCKKVYNNKKSTLTTVYEYQDGILVKTVCTPSDNSFTRMCEYNVDGLVSTETYTSSNGYYKITSFYYDRYGNVYREKMVYGNKNVSNNEDSSTCTYYHKKYKVVAVKEPVL